MAHRYSVEKAEAFKLEDVIIENILKPGVTLEPKDVREIKNLNLQLCQGRPYALFVDMQEDGHITDEARALLASKEMAGLTIAKAILIYTTKQKILGNLYLSFDRPAVKTRMFTNRDKAIAWLHEQITEFQLKEFLT